MHIIDMSIKGDVVDAFIDQAAATACRMTGMDTILYPALFMRPAGYALLAADLAAWLTLAAPPALRAWVEDFTQRVVLALMEAATLAHRHTGVATEHEAGITDAALTAGWFTALGRGEARAAHRAGVTTELVVAVRRALDRTEVWPPPLAKLGPSGLAGYHVDGHGRAEASRMALSLAGVQQAGLEVLLGRHEVVAGCQWAIRGRDHAAALRASEGLLLVGRARHGARPGFAPSAVRVAAHLPALGVPVHRLHVVFGVLVVVPAQATKGARVRRRHAQAHVAVPVESQRKPRGCGHYHVVAAQVSLQERVQVEGQRHELAVHLQLPGPAGTEGQVVPADVQGDAAGIADGLAATVFIGYSDSEVLGPRRWFMAGCAQQVLAGTVEVESVPIQGDVMGITPSLTQSCADRMAAILA